jgi:hypothetical protein
MRDFIFLQLEIRLTSREALAKFPFSPTDRLALHLLRHTIPAYPVSPMLPRHGVIARRQWVTDILIQTPTRRMGLSRIEQPLHPRVLADITAHVSLTLRARMSIAATPGAVDLLAPSRCPRLEIWVLQRVDDMLTLLPLDRQRRLTCTDAGA